MSTLDTFYVAAICESCEAENYKIETDTRLGSMKVQECLQKESKPVCTKCGRATLKFCDIEIKEEGAESSPEKKEMKEALLAFIQRSEEDILLKERTKGRRGRAIRNRLSLVSKEEERHYEYYQKAFGNVATFYIQNEDRPHHSVVIGTNEYQKSVIRMLAKEFRLVHIGDFYDQIDAPEYTFTFDIDSPEEAVRFLMKARTYKQVHDPKGDVAEKLVVSIQDITHHPMNGKQTYILLMDYADWQAFGQFLHAEEHYYIQEVQELATSLQLDECYEGQFLSDLSVEQVKEVFFKCPKFVWDESFHQYAIQHREDLQYIQGNYK